MLDLEVQRNLHGIQYERVRFIPVTSQANGSSSRVVKD